MTFPGHPNTKNEIGEPSELSACQRFRLTESIDGFYCQSRPNKEAPWYGVEGQPFASRAAAIKACERLATGMKLTRRRYRKRSEETEVQLANQ